MIEIFPAIDMMGNKVVRLREGDFSHRTDYVPSPLTIAEKYAEEGFRNIHLVDLEGARLGSVQQLSVIEEIVRQTPLRVDYGGGIRSDADVANVLKAGAVSVNVGSIAVNDPALLQEWISRYGSDTFIVAVDVREEYVAVHGWKDTTLLSWRELIPRIIALGIATFSVTAIQRDGRMAGADMVLYRKIRKQFPDINIIASGGVASVHEITEMEQAGLYGVIIGKALLDGTIQPDELKKFL